MSLDEIRRALCPKCGSTTFIRGGEGLRLISSPDCDVCQGRGTVTEAQADAYNRKRLDERLRRDKR